MVVHTVVWCRSAAKVGFEPKAEAKHRRSSIRKAIKGNLRSIKCVLDQFIKYNAVTPPALKILTGVLRLPIDELPFELSKLVFCQHGPQPWTKAQIALWKESYLQTRAERQAAEDEHRGYDL